MIFIFDLDDTLINTKKIKKEIKKIFYQDDKFDYYYQKFLKKEKLFNFLNFLSFLKTEKVIEEKNIKKLQKQHKDFLKNTSLISQETKNKIKNIGKNHDLILLTLGEKKYQREKIKSQKLDSYFKKIVITKEKKENSLNFLQNKKDTTYFINDKKAENKIIKKKFPHFHIIHIKNEKDLEKFLCKF